MNELSTKCSRGTSSIARSTAGSLMPRLRRPSRNCMRPTLSSPGGCLGTPSLLAEFNLKPAIDHRAAKWTQIQSLGDAPHGITAAARPARDAPAGVPQLRLDALLPLPPACSDRERGDT